MMRRVMKPSATRGRRCGIGLLAASLSLSACDDSPGAPNVEGRATVSVYLKDAPGDVDSVWIRIDAIILKSQDAPLTLLDEPTELVNLRVRAREGGTADVREGFAPR